MISVLLPIALFFAQAPPPTTVPEPRPSAPADTTARSTRVVRRFPPIEVRATAVDLLSSQTVHAVESAALSTLPVDELAQVLALQAGVVAEGEVLHVRGGRAGETVVTLDGVGLNESLRNRPLALPLLAIRGVDLVSGAPEARYASGLAGALDLQTVDPSRRLSGELRWQTDGRLDTRFDRVSGRAVAPLGRLGLGLVAAADALLDDTYLPALRSESRRRIAGLSFGWRAENRMLGFLKLAHVEQPRRFNAQLLMSRQVHRPYDPSWSLDGWSLLPADPKGSPTFSSVQLPGYLRYRAADHLAITDDRGVAALASVSTLRKSGRGTVALGWTRMRTVTSLDGKPRDTDVSLRPSYGSVYGPDRFHVLWGDYSLYRESGSDQFTLRGDGEFAVSGSTFKAGAGVTYDELRMREVEWLPLSWPFGGEPTTTQLDTTRTYHVWAPGSFAYVQNRWLSGGLVLNTGLRAEYWTAGPQASRQTLPDRGRGVLSWSPRLGIAYPISVRDAFSLAYLRAHQAPARDFLYDQREAISGRQPLGNPALVPATLISYEASVKHLLDATRSLQVSVFYRDFFGQVGARDVAVPHGETNLSYTNDDEGHTLGFELSLAPVQDERRRLQVQYTWMQAWGNESNPEGDPYRALRGPTTPLIAETPLSWDRRHSISVNGAWGWREHWTLSWITAVGSPLPWTPKPLREAFTDYESVNSRRLGWTEVTNASLQWLAPVVPGLTLGFEARNLFDHRGDRVATIDGYPNPLINTLYDDYGAYRTETGLGGGAYYATPGGEVEPYWVRVHDPRLSNPPRALRAMMGLRW
jgi:outer membrane receptor protein involved in Fe transport